MYALLIATPEKVVFEGQVISLSAPGGLGYFEVLSQHAPMIRTLTAGQLTVTDANKKKWSWFIEGGLFEVDRNQATLLADSLSLKEEKS